MNVNKFQPWCVDYVLLGPTSRCDLCDYWAKQESRKSRAATCEGMANKGISMHGRIYTHSNPTQRVRDQHPEPPERGGAALCREYHRAFSDSSTQDAYDTAATKLAEDTEFVRSHPWLNPRNHVGSISDGASNYACTSSLMFDLVSPHTNAKAKSERG